MAGTDKQWENWGRQDPYFGVLTDPQFLRSNLDAEKRDIFFKTGETFISSIIDQFPHLQMGKAMDFGCGVGRLSLPLAKRFGTVTAIDVSPSMIMEARKNASQFSLDNISFVDVLPKDSEVGYFDFVISYIVLQHIDPNYGYGLIEMMLKSLKPSGSAMIHVGLKGHSSKLRRSAYFVRDRVPLARYLFDLARGRPLGSPVMQMKKYDIITVLRIFEKYKMPNVTVKLEKHAHALTACFSATKKSIEKMSKNICFYEIGYAMDDENFDVIVLGAGISGLATAYYLALSGSRVLILDHYVTAGGNHISIDKNGFTFDIGSIFFSSNNPQFEMFPGLKHLLVPVKLDYSKVTPRKNICTFPISFKSEILRSPWVTCRTIIGVIYSRIRNEVGRDAQSYAQYYLGKYFYKISGLRNYMLRFYGIDPSQIGLEFTKRRMDLEQMTSVKRVFSILSRYLDGNSLKSFLSNASAVARPIEGFPFLYAQMVQALVSKGVRAAFDVRFESIAKYPLNFEIRTDTKTYTTKRIVNTFPIAIVSKLLKMNEPINLESTSLRTLLFSFDGRRGFDTVVLYNFDDVGRWKRLTMHSDYYGKKFGREYFCCEFVSSATPIDEKVLFREFVEHANEIGIFRGDLRLEGHIDLDYAYPICDLQSQARRDVLLKTLEDMGIESVGRQGHFDYIPHSTTAIQAVKTRYAPPKNLS